MIKKLAWQNIEHGITAVGINHRFTIQAENNKHRLHCLNLITDKVIDIIDRDTQAEVIAEANLRNKYYARDFIEPVSDTLSDTLKWFELAVPEPTIENICVQFGCDLEEQSEILRACNQHSLAEQVESYANDFKAKRTWCMNAINCIDKTELLDGLIDRQVTGLGLGYMLKMNTIAAASEVNRSNWSKFENGKPVFDDNGKIKKGANYTPPQLEEFI